MTLLTFNLSNLTIWTMVAVEQGCRTCGSSRIQNPPESSIAATVSSCGEHSSTGTACALQRASSRARLRRTSAVCTGVPWPALSWSTSTPSTSHLNVKGASCSAVTWAGTTTSTGRSGWAAAGGWTPGWSCGATAAGGHMTRSRTPCSWGSTCRRSGGGRTGSSASWGTSLLESIEMLGVEPIPDVVRFDDKGDFVPVLPSHDFGLLLTIKPKQN